MNSISVRASRKAPAAGGRSASGGANAPQAPAAEPEAQRLPKVHHEHKSKSAIPRNIRYDLENALVGLCDVWFEDIKPYLLRNKVKVHVPASGEAAAGGDPGHPGPPPNTPAPRTSGCSHLDPGAASDRRRHRSVNCANSSSTPQTVLKAQQHKPLKQPSEARPQAFSQKTHSTPKVFPSMSLVKYVSNKSTQTETIAAMPFGVQTQKFQPIFSKLCRRKSSSPPPRPLSSLTKKQSQSPVRKQKSQILKTQLLTLQPSQQRTTRRSPSRSPVQKRNYQTLNSQPLQHTQQRSTKMQSPVPKQKSQILKSQLPPRQRIRSPQPCRQGKCFSENQTCVRTLPVRRQKSLKLKAQMETSKAPQRETKSCYTFYGGGECLGQDPVPTNSTNTLNDFIDPTYNDRFDDEAFFRNDIFDVLGASYDLYLKHPRSCPKNEERTSTLILQHVQIKKYLKKRAPWNRGRAIVGSKLAH